eukprot:TRINITY_DN12114_c0_g1_i11.p2 TRINITY_DN12114_c0_g1~~TRINITY_DN12114_c0_g1_i11.p2  ORF type:complete len:134 (-),score=61.64 TRINITY_DN12114_c0_g1_i11:61-462(-)
MAETDKGEKAKVIEEYKELNNQQANVVMLFYNIAEEKRQHDLVLEALKTSSPDYRAWRIRNGVLTETVVKEAIPDIEKDIQQLAERMEKVNGEAKKIQEQMKVLEEKYEGIVNAKGKVEEKKVEAGTEKGLLA